MALLLSCQGIAKAYGTPALFTDLSFGLFDGERAGLVGPNGSGKSTLIKLLAGIETPDAGTIAVRRHASLGHVPQDVVFVAERTVEQIVASALADENLDEDELHTRVQVTLGKCGFHDGSIVAGDLSGGLRKRLAMACALASRPDLLLLDEPTNHLDLDGILWLERLLRTEPFAWLVVSHDRAFLGAVANRVLELDRRHPGGLLDASGGYADFLARKAEVLEAQSRREEALANRVRRELEWLKRGPKARTTKARSRIDEAARTQDELADLRDRTRAQAARIDFSATERRTRRLLTAQGIAKSFGERPLFTSLDLTIHAGMRLGLLGPNGSGKTTLLRILAGEIDPDAGTIARADDLRVVYFDQDREQLDPEATLRRTLAPDGDQVVYRGRPVHVAGWAQRFLFGADKLELPVSRLSGGERARLVIARLMLRPADVLVLDEPTNDLDLETLEELEESLLDFPGALVLVTHDRFLFDRVTTSALALDGRGGAERFADRAQAEAARLARASAEGRRETRTPAAAERTRPSRAAQPRLSYAEKREWEQIEGRILAAEADLEERKTAAADPAIASDAGELAQRYRALHAAQEEVDRLYARWAELAEKRGEG
jgi:ATP-binding cassette subfamily F protein uup